MGCKKEAYIQVNTSDLDHVVQTKEVVYIPMWIAFEIPSQSEFRKAKGFLQESLNHCFQKSVSALEYNQDGATSMVTCKTMIPIAHQSNPDNAPNNLFVYVVNEDSSGLFMNDDIYKQLGSAIWETYMYEIDITKSDVQIGYVPDKGTVQKTFYPNFIQGNPELKYTTWEIDGKLNLKLSNLSLQYMKDRNYVPLVNRD